MVSDHDTQLSVIEEVTSDTLGPRHLSVGQLLLRRFLVLLGGQRGRPSKPPKLVLAAVESKEPPRAPFPYASVIDVTTFYSEAIH